MDHDFYITSTLPYTNSDPHIGFAAEMIKADVLARYERQRGKEVFFNTGTDEHGLKIYLKAAAAGLTPRQYCDPYAERFLALKNALNLSFNNFIRTTDEHHIAAVQEFWRRCENAGDIYKKNYQVKYCIGCELEKSDSDLENGHCPFHPSQELEIIEEENYFFRFSRYGEALLKFYDEHQNFVVPEHRFKEIRNFVAAGLKDFSISRVKDKMPNGVPVPGDDSQVIYVWFDALVNYISALNWPDNQENFQKFWPGLQVCGKDNLRQQTAMWPAMLMSAGLPVAKQVLVFGFLTVNGQKISKSAGNNIDPFAFAEKYGADALRYYLTSDILPFEDGDFSEDALRSRYNSDLANGLGNLAARVSNLLEKNAIATSLEVNLNDESFKETKENFEASLEKYRFHEALQTIWEKIRAADEELSRTTPWKLKDQEEIAKILKPLAQDIINIAYLLEPFLPQAAGKLREQFSAVQVRKGDALFPRLD